MRNFGKKTVSAVVSLILALSIMPGAVLAEETASGAEEVVIPGVFTAEDIVALDEESEEESDEIVVELDVPSEETIEEEEIIPEDIVVDIEAPDLETEEPEVSEEQEIVEEPAEEIVEEPAEEVIEENLEEVSDVVIEEPAEETTDVVEETEEVVDQEAEESETMLFATGVYSFADGQITLNITSCTAHSGDSSSASFTAKGGLLSKTTATAEVINDSGKVARISFDYSATGKVNACTVGTSTEKSGSYFADLGAGEVIKISVQSTSGLSSPTATFTISNFKIEEILDTNNVTFVYDSAMASVSVNGTAISSGESMDVSFSEGATLAVTPVSGVSLVGWINEATGEIVAADGILKASESMTVKALFEGKGNPAVFGNGKYYMFDDLNDAIAAATSSTTKVVHVVSNGTLPAGTYTVPSGITLLIPFDDANTVYTTEPAVINSTYEKPSIYRTLTMEAGANLIVNGALCVSNKILSGNAGYRAGSPTGPLSMIKMENGSNITVNNGGAAYVYGFVYGDGDVFIKDGATVYECMQVLDFRGGSCTTGMINNDEGVFPFNQYYVQNFEVPTTYEGGAKEYVVTSIYMSYQAIRSSVPFIGTSDCMFVPAKGTTFVKTFDPASGRTIVDVYGDVSMSSIKTKISIYTLDSSKSVLPITSSLTINVHSGTATVEQDIALLPGAELNVAKGSVLKLTEGHEAYAYDLDEWKGNNFVYGRANDKFWDGDHSWLTYTATTTSTKQTLKDAKIDVNGDIIGDGYLYTTVSGAEVISSEGTGVITLNSWDPTENPVTYQMKLASGEFTEVPVASVMLKNADGSYTETVNPSKGIAPLTGKYLYEDGKWTEWRPGIYFDANGGEGTMDPQYSDLSTAITLNKNAFTRDGYTFIGWSLTPNGDVDISDGGMMGVVEEEITLYAVWEEIACAHTNKEPAVPAEAPTCMEPGITAGLKCADCHVILEEPVEIPVDPDAHAYSYTYNNDAKCGENGTKTAVCGNGCGATDTVVAEGTALSHSFTSYTYNNDAKCEVDGTKTATCDHGCGATDTVVAEGTALSHSYTDYVSDNNATLTEDGTKTAICDNGCGAKDTKVDVGSRTGLKNINLTYGRTDAGMKFDAIVEGYKGTGHLYVAIYNAQGKLLTAEFTAVVADNVATVTFGNVANAAYAKVYAWDGCKPVATYKVQSL